MYWHNHLVILLIISFTDSPDIRSMLIPIYDDPYSIFPTRLYCGEGNPDIDAEVSLTSDSLSPKEIKVFYDNIYWLAYVYLFQFSKREKVWLASIEWIYIGPFIKQIISKYLT